MKSYYEEKQNSSKKVRDAAQKILAVSEELHLTIREFEQAIDYTKDIAIINRSDEE